MWYMHDAQCAYTAGRPITIESIDGVLEWSSTDEYAVFVYKDDLNNDNNIELSNIQNARTRCVKSKSIY